MVILNHFASELETVKSELEVKIAKSKKKDLARLQETLTLVQAIRQDIYNTNLLQQLEAVNKRLHKRLVIAFAVMLAD